MTDRPDLDIATDAPQPGNVMETIPRPARLGALMVFALGALGLALLAFQLVNQSYG